jgi:hypothetical protein
MANFELARRRPDQAAAILAELPSAPPELLDRIEGAREKQALSRAQMEMIRQQYDPAIGRKRRALLAGLAMLFFTLTPLVSMFLEKRAGGPSAERSIGNALALIIAASVIAIVRRSSLTQSSVNRRIFAFVLFTFVAQLFLELGGAPLGVPPGSMIVIHFFLWFVVVGSIALTIDKRLLVAAIAYLASFLFLCHRPELRWHVMVVANFVLAANVFLAWGIFPAKQKT